MESFKPLIAKVAAGATLSRAEAASAFDAILSGEVTPSQMGGFLMALRVRGETVDEMTGAVSAMRAKMLTVRAPADAIDIVGTGGDSSGSYNVSTLASIVAAACGVPVAKHGNRAASSRSGAADTLTALGVKIGLPPEGVERCIREVGIGFMMAPSHHAAMRHVGPTWRIAAWWVGAIMKPMPTSRMQRSITSGATPTLTPSAASVSAAPDLEEAARLPCLATGTPQAATISAASVETL